MFMELEQWHLEDHDGPQIKISNYAYVTPSKASSLDLSLS